MEKKQISGLVSILISAAIAIAALWGYNIVVVQPMAEQVVQNTVDLYGTEAQGGDRAVGETNVTNLVTSGSVTAGGAVTGGSVAALGVISGTTLTGPGGANVVFADDGGPVLDIDTGNGVLTLGDVNDFADGYKIVVDGSGVIITGEEVTVYGTTALQQVKRSRFFPDSVMGNRTLTVDESGRWFKVAPAGAATVTLPLPNGNAGLMYCFYMSVAQTLYVDPPAAMTIQALTNAAGDRISNGTLGDSVCLYAPDEQNWYVVGRTGTWADAN
jgi:hypothetical protein